MRRLLLRALQQAGAERDYESVARLNARLGQEALRSARRALDAWTTRRDAATGLVPKSHVASMQHWNARDVAGDLYRLVPHSMDRRSRELLWAFVD